MHLGPLAALDAHREGDRPAPGLGLIGYCIGGTLMAVMLAYMAAPATPHRGLHLLQPR